MEGEIVNKVANSGLITIDLEDYYPKGERVLFDIKDWLFEELLLKEKDFRAYVKEHNWEQYQGKYVALTCSTDAIIPGWAFILLVVELQPYTKRIVKGNLEKLETALYQEEIAKLDVSPFEDKRLIIKGCSNLPVPESAYIELVQKLRPIAKSLMYGEACSTVPLYKKR